MRSLLRRLTNSSSTCLAASMRFGTTSASSIEFDKSSASTMSRVVRLRSALLDAHLVIAGRDLRNHDRLRAGRADQLFVHEDVGAFEVGCDLHGAADLHARKLRQPARGQ